MMDKKAFLLSTSLSLLAMYLVYQYVTTQDTQLQAEFGVFHPVVVASRDILQYETIRPTDIEVVRVPHSLAPENRIENPRDVIDAVAAIPITKGEHILDNKVISKNVYSGLDTQVTIGRRAISIPVNTKSSVGFLLRPGNRIDLLAHFEYKGTGAAISEEKVFMQDLLVLAVGRTIQAEAPKAVDQSLVNGVFNQMKKSSKQELVEIRDTLNYAKQDVAFQTVTVEVTPEQAQKIAYVTSVFGDALGVVLRHSDDRQLARTPTANLRAVMGDDSFLVRGAKVPPLKALPRSRFNDFYGEQTVPVY